MAKASGSGAVDTKLSLLRGLLSDASPQEAKYILRTVTGSLRLGIADMTVLDALAIAYGGGKEARGEIERAYNISSALGCVGKFVAEKGLAGIKEFHVTLFEPIRPMLAERLGSPEEILDRFGGRCIPNTNTTANAFRCTKRAMKSFCLVGVWKKSLTNTLTLST
jgi:DNA ligase-1